MILCSASPPNKRRAIHFYDKDESLFDHLGVEQEMARALSRKVWLKSGGYLVIDHTEAMTVIDVNTGRFVGKRDQEETILRNNLEAAKEVAYQVKLRGIGGIIIVDFIDMEREKNRDKVYHALGRCDGIGQGTDEDFPDFGSGID